MRPRVLSLTLVLLFIGAASAHARPLAISKEFQTDKKLGAGLTLGVPTGASVKFLFTPTLAVDLGVGAYFLYRDRNGFHAHADLLWHPFVAVEGETFLAPLYVGLGSRLLIHDDINHVGVRVPVGIAFVFDDAPVDVFLEGAFVYDFSISEDANGNAADGADAVDMNALVGVRYYFM
ncbi:hypothetical protein [Haliangium sp.]|uniref:hypothetical protein n=1 Tax=Haliangium sp. TaxID=2663208 RepID=UPI003D0BC879